MTTYEDVVNLALRRSLFFPTSEIYANTPAGFWDFGPYGASIHRKVGEVWRRHLVQGEGMLEISGSVAMPADVFKASGHLDKFNDPVTSCQKCGTLQRADKLLSEATGKDYKEAQSDAELTKALREHRIKCPACKGELSDVRRSSLMVRAEVGIATKGAMYLRPETCQTLFVDFARMAKTMRLKLPQGLAQDGLAFRNEISPRQTLMRQISFYQMEAEVFFDPAAIDDVERFDEVADYPVMIQRVGQDKAAPHKAKDLVEKKIVSGKVIAYYLSRTQQLFELYGIPREKMRFRELDDEERAFYAKEAWDFEVLTSLGWLELVANNYRTDYDLKKHSDGSKQDLSYVSPEGKKVLPHVWEISIGHDRAFYAALEFAYRSDDKRMWLALPARIAPILAGVYPLLANKPELVAKAKEVYETLREDFEVFYDQSGTVGKRYARMDEVGVPYGITIDFDGLNDGTVTIRDRDSTEQRRVKIAELAPMLKKLLKGVPFQSA